MADDLHIPGILTFFTTETKTWTRAVKKSYAHLEKVFLVLLLEGTCSFTWSIKNTGVLSRWALLRPFNTLVILQALLLSCSGHKPKCPSLSEKIPKGSLVSIFFFFNTMHSTGTIPKNGDDTNILHRIAFLLTASTSLLSFTLQLPGTS